MNTDNVPAVRFALRSALAEALRWSPKSFAGAEAIRAYQTLAGAYVQRLIDDENARGEIAQKDIA